MQINERIQENAQIRRYHIVLQFAVVDVPRRQHEITVEQDVQTGPVVVQLRHGQTELGQVFRKARERDQIVHHKRFNRHSAGRVDTHEKVSIRILRTIGTRNKSLRDIIYIYIYMLRDK